MLHKKIIFLIFFILKHCITIDAQDLDLMMARATYDDEIVDKIPNAHNIALLPKKCR